jgi:hypothetical protein
MGHEGVTYGVVVIAVHMSDDPVLYYCEVLGLGFWVGHVGRRGFLFVASSPSSSSSSCPTCFFSGW